MDPAAQLNATIEAHHPGAAACLSRVGRRLFFPLGIPAQSAEAKGCAINATIGQVTDGSGGSLALPAVAGSLGELDAGEATLYAAQGGRGDLRRLWAEHIAADAPGDAVPCELPVVTGGLTHGLAMVAELFADEGTPVLMPDPAWGNYGAIFSRRRGAALRTWRLLRDDGDTTAALDLDAFRAALAAMPGPGVLILNFPSNPTGYAPSAAEVDALVAAIADSPHPLVVVCDDAYHGMWWEPGVYQHSVFHRVATCAPGRVLALKIDGATKELLYFGGRVGFVTVGDAGPAGDAIEDKLRAVARATISSVSATSQAVLTRALRDPELPDQQRYVRERLRRRYAALRQALADQGLRPLPFNSGMFAVVPVPGDPEALRKTLLAEGVGVVSLPESGALRLSYGSVCRADLPALVAAIARHAG